MTLAGNIILITGASRGYGYALANACADAGAHVIAVARNKAQLEALDDAIQARGHEPATLVPMDITQPALVDQLGAQIYQRFGRLDAMVANAGCLASLSPASHITPAHWERTIGVNLTANMRLIRSMDALLKASPSPRVCFVTCRMGRDLDANRGNAFWGAYAASKAALEVLATSYADEVAGQGMRVSMVDLGPMGTALHSVAFPGIPTETLPKPESRVHLVMDHLLQEVPA